MHQEPRIQEHSRQDYAGIQVTVPLDGISGAVDEAFPELFGWLAGQQMPPGGPPFIRYLVTDMPAKLRLDLAVPVAAPVAGSGRIRPGLLPAGRYAVLRHTGPYEGLIAGNAALLQWAGLHGVDFDTRDTPEGTAWAARVERYVTDPSVEPDPSKWEVDVEYLIRA